MEHRNRKRHPAAARLLALALVLILALCGCQKQLTLELPDIIPPASSSPSGSPAAPSSAPGSASAPSGAAGSLNDPAGQEELYQPGEYKMVPFGQMTYVRPDVDALEKLFDACCDRAATAGAGDGEELEALLETCWDAYDEYYTMEVLAMLRHDIDQTDGYYAEEYDFCWANDVKLEEWLDRTLIACAGSAAPVKSSLLAGYDQGENEPYSDRALELMNRESALISDYWDAISLDEITVDGKAVSYIDTVTDPSVDSATYNAASIAYSRACNEAAAPIYIELIRVRRELAEELGYESYEQYCYDTYARDYTPDQVRTYLDDMASAIADYYVEFMETDPYGRVSYDYISSSDLLAQLESSIADMGETATEAFAFMKDYDLYDTTVTYDKAAGSYTIYLDSYEAPFCYIDAYGDVEDFLDFAHEFGHFADAYCNYNATTSLDLAETYSQAMANLALYKCRELLDREDYENLRLLHILSTMSTFTEQSSYAAFESAAYRLSDEELTVENLNSLALECDRRFGAVASGGEELSRFYWAQVTHLFESPFYVISYVVSADAAAQILEREIREPGAGVAVYEDMLDWHEDAFLSEVRRVGLESPFEAGRMARNVELVRTILEAGIPGLELDAA